MDHIESGCYNINRLHYQITLKLGREFQDILPPWGGLKINTGLIKEEKEGRQSIIYFTKSPGSFKFSYDWKKNKLFVINFIYNDSCNPYKNAWCSAIVHMSY